MADKTVFTGVKVAGDLEASGTMRINELDAGNTKVNTIEISSVKRDLLEVISPAAEEAAGSAPTKAEYDAVANLVNEIKTKYNNLLGYLAK